MHWFMTAFRRYADFSGRSRRKEFWGFALICVLGGIALVIADVALGTYNPESGLGLLSGLFTLVLLVPSVAVTVRRLHDIDRSGWWYLIGFIPLLGGIVLLVFSLRDGTPGSNRFGESPKLSA